MPDARTQSDTSGRGAIEALVAGLTDAWNRGDARAFSARFAADGSFTNVLGIVAYGRENFELRHAEIFSSLYKGSMLQQSIGKLRFIRPDVAVVDVDAAVTGYLRLPPGVQTASDGSPVRQTSTGPDQGRRRMVDCRISQCGCQAAAIPVVSGCMINVAIGVLRLRRNFAPRSSGSAQDDMADLISF